MSNTNNAPNTSTPALKTASEIAQEIHGCAAGDLIELDHKQQAEALKSAAAGGTEAFVSTLIFLLPLHLRTAAADAWANGELNLAKNRKTAPGETWRCC